MAEARAPGKLMVAGEYAVLFPGGACVAVAVGEVAHASWRPADRATLTLDAFDSVRTWAWEAVPREGLMAFVVAAVQRAVATHHSTMTEHDLGALQVRVGGQRAGRKLGLGSSAATTVAVLRATLRSLGAVAPPAQVAALADAVHLACQSGKGSGYDVHTIAHGGCVAYAGQARRATPLRWPPGLHGAALYTGQPASTVAALRRGVGADSPGVPEIGAACRTLTEAWRDADVDAVLASAARCELAFDRLAAHHPWLVPEALVQTRDHIRQYGAVARTSGAGGGDCVLALSNDASCIDALVASWRDGSVALLPADLAPVEES